MIKNTYRWVAVWVASQFVFAAMASEVEPFGKTTEGVPVNLYTLKNKNGMTMRVMDYGGTVVSLTAPDRKGQFEDVTLGFGDLKRYEQESPFFGCLVGRYGNRIAHGKFELGGKTYSLALNNSPGGIPCSLHGGNKGFNKAVWHARPFVGVDGEALELTHLSRHGDEGYPGNLFVRVVYTLTDQNEWRIEYWAMTDAATPINLTQHAYFNLTACKRDILDHEMMINADAYTPTNAGLIPTGEIAPVKGTPLDFTQPIAVGARIEQDFEALKLAGGYDHNWVLHKGEGLKRAARVKDPESGRVMEVFTTEPGVQFYAGNFLDGSLKGKGGITYTRRFGLCLETQHFPDSPNQPSFPTTILEPGQVYQQTTVYKFSAE
jgi:aldose 1-epimerase